MVVSRCRGIGPPSGIPSSGLCFCWPPTTSSANACSTRPRRDRLHGLRQSQPTARDMSEGRKHSSKRSRPPGPQRYWSSLRYSFLRTLFLLAADYVVSQRLQHSASPRQIARSPTVPADGSRHVRGAQALKQAQRAAGRPRTLYSARRRRLSCAAGSISCGGPDGRRQPPPLLRHRGL